MYNMYTYIQWFISSFRLLCVLFACTYVYAVVSSFLNSLFS